MPGDRSDDMPGLVVMGVTGCGKSSVAAALAKRIGARLIEGDAFHPPANIARMSAGIPLTDADRAGWLDRLGEEARACLAGGEVPIVTCSALRRAYRDRLRAAVPGIGFLFLALDRSVAAERVARRPAHFMPPSLVASQFATLEPPFGEASTMTLDATLPLAAIVERATLWWEARPDKARGERPGAAPARLPPG
ncbi:gluconokinase [Ancylobacter sp. 6x-1]|uniref:Gluconokinase n=1 Tax=Ancylobacter crimeensis TaxID=2579147 RepID=A0ABT0D8Z2_9HYPH|nr:gluconokinase [Ancylobacter crimeensis]MCK0196423.1 gluconokinase [Ancylobacter crimeensis]